MTGKGIRRAEATALDSFLSSLLYLIKMPFLDLPTSSRGHWEPAGTDVNTRTSLSHAHAHLNYLSVFDSQTKRSLCLQSLWNGQINIPLTHTVLLDESPHYTLQAWLKHCFLFTDQQWNIPLKQNPVSTSETWNNFKTLLKTVILMKFVYHNFKL